MSARWRLGSLAVWVGVLALARGSRPVPPYEGEVTGERVYIRAGDGINYTVLGVASRGDRVTVTGQRFGWLAVPVPRHCTVWVHKGLVTADAGGKEGTVGKDRVNVRARPSLKADVLGQLAAGARVKLVDEDGEWLGIGPPPHARAWLHGKLVRKVGPARPQAEPAKRPKSGMDAAAGLVLLRQARKACDVELARPAKARKFGGVLRAYQEVAAACEDEATARRAEQARQRLLKIVDLHQTLRALREPLEQFEKKYEGLEAEYKRRGEPGGEAKDE